MTVFILSRGPGFVESLRDLKTSRLKIITPGQEQFVFRWNANDLMHVRSSVYITCGIESYMLHHGCDPWCVKTSLLWRHNGRDGVSNHQPHHCLLNRLLGRRSKKTSKLCVTGLCVGKSPVPADFPAQMAVNAENVFIWWRHHVWIYTFMISLWICITSSIGAFCGGHNLMIYIWQ